MTGFLAGAAVWRSTAQHLRLPNAVLYAEDAAELLPALFGCWAAGVHVILPGDALPGTLERLSAAGLTAKNTMLGLDAAAMDESCSWSIMTPECRFSDFNRLPPCADLPLLDDKAELLSLLTSSSESGSSNVSTSLKRSMPASLNVPANHRLRGANLKCSAP